ncbi:MAG: hypothetical protein K2X91_03640, partial [Thermoleophilia bacterium]|nr:hypothetical protein [Thermoleophilia bacterium]
PLEAVEELAAEGVHTLGDLDARVKDAATRTAPNPTRYTVLKQLLPQPVALAAGDALVDAEKPPAPTPAGGKARDQAAAIAGTSPRYVQEAKALKAAAPEQFAAVKAGSKTLPEAKRDAGLTPKPKADPKPSILVSAKGGPEDARRSAAVGAAADPLAQVTAELMETAHWLEERADVFAKLIEGVSARQRGPLSVEVAKLRGRAKLVRQTARSAKGGAA